MNAKWQRAANLLGTGMHLREVARDVGVCERTLSKWGRDARFRAMRDEATRAYVSEVLPRAIEVIVRQMDNAEDKVAQSAAEKVVKLADGNLAHGQGGLIEVIFLGMPAPGEMEPV